MKTRMIRDVSVFTPTFLTAQLRHVLHDNKLVVCGVSTEPLSLKTAYCAQLHRLTLTYSVPAQGSPQTLIAKLPVDSPGMIENQKTFQPGTKEDWFYREVAADSSIKTPRCYFSVASRELGVAALLLEDLGQSEAMSQVDGMSESDAELALAEIAELHARWWNTTDDSRLGELKAASGDGSSGAALVRHLYKEAWEPFLNHSRFDIPDDVKAFGTLLMDRDDVFECISRSSSKTLLHGDFRVDNLLFRDDRDGRNCFVIDWESVDIGNSMIDVGWLIAGCIPNISKETELRLLKHYMDCLQNAGVQNYASDVGFTDYRMCMIEPFVQGVLSGTLYEPNAATQGEIAFASAIGSRFVAAAHRLELLNLVT